MEENYQIDELDKENKKVNPELIILVKEVGQKPKFMKIKNEVSEIESLVGGHIDTYNLDDVVIVYNEDHEHLNLKPNIAIDLKVIFGNCFIVGDDYINGEFKSLSKNQIIKYAKFLSTKSFSYDNESRIIAERKKYFEKKGLVNNLESGIGQKEDMIAQVNSLVSTNQVLNTNQIVKPNTNINPNTNVNTARNQILNNDNNSQLLNEKTNRNKIKENEMLDIDDLDLYLEDEKVDESKKQKKRGRKPKKDKIKQEIIKENITLDDVNKMDFKDLNDLVDKLIVNEMKIQNKTDSDENKIHKDKALKESLLDKNSLENSMENSFENAKEYSFENGKEENMKQELINNDLLSSNKGLIITNDSDNQLIDEIRLTLYKILLNQTYIYRKLKKIENQDKK